MKPPDARYWRAWQHLTAARQAGFGGMQPVPESEIEAYLNVRLIGDPALREAYSMVIRQLDVAYLVRQAALNKKPDPPADE